MSFIVTDKKGLCEVMREVLPEALKETTRVNPEKLFTLRETAQKLEIKYKKLWRLVKAGRIATTSDGKHITQLAITNYLQPKNKQNA